MPEKPPIKLRFNRVKETKNTVKFEEEAVEGQAPAVGTLYVQKWVAGKAASLDVTISVAL